MHTSARFSACRRYRFALWRRWAEGPQVLFVMLNPSTADEDHDDPTIRRCIGFARSWGFAALAVGNLFAWRCSSPADLRSCPRPVGGSNDKWLLRLQASSAMTVAAWGNHGRLLGRSETVRALLSGMHRLSLTRPGEPRHPLYVPANAIPVCWDAGQRASRHIRASVTRAKEPHYG
jgi:hypothetical protein